MQTIVRWRVWFKDDEGQICSLVIRGVELTKEGAAAIFRANYPDADFRGRVEYISSTEEEA